MLVRDIPHSPLFTVPDSRVKAGEIYSLRRLVQVFNLTWVYFVKTQLVAYLDECERAQRAGLTADEWKIDEIKTAIRDAETACERAGWKDAQKHIEAITHGHSYEFGYEFVSSNYYGELVKALQVAIQTLDRELENHLFINVPAGQAEMYKNPLGWFPKTVSAFPSSSYNVIEAVRCYALSRWAGCVYHAMGIVQAGLYAMARELRIEFSFPLELAEWHNIIDRIEKEIRSMKDLPKGQAKDETLKFYSECAYQFGYFKDAWRNHVAHYKREWGEADSHNVLLHVRDFMEKLSERIEEKEIPEV